MLARPARLLGTWASFPIAMTPPKESLDLPSKRALISPQESLDLPQESLDPLKEFSQVFFIGLPTSTGTPREQPPPRPIAQTPVNGRTRHRAFRLVLLVHIATPPPYCGGSPMAFSTNFQSCSERNDGQMATLLSPVLSCAGAFFGMPPAKGAEWARQRG